MKRTFLCTVFLFTLITTSAYTQETSKIVSNRVLDQPKALTEIGEKTSTIFEAKKDKLQFNLHSYIAFFDGRFWAVWSSGLKDEDSANQHIRFSTSEDGQTWSESKILADDPDGSSGPKRWIARGVFVHHGKLYALGAFMNNFSNNEWEGLKLVYFEYLDGIWVNRGTMIDQCMNNFPPLDIGERYFMTCRDSKGRLSMAFSYKHSLYYWELHPLANSSRLSEPSTYLSADSILHTLFRDQGKSGFLYHSTSNSSSNYENWSKPVQTNFPDATSKNFSLPLSDGRIVVLNNPEKKLRDPLAITLSNDGWSFNQAYAVRKNAPPQKFPGRAKNKFSFQYPHAIERNGKLWVVYSTNKEDIEITSIPLSSLKN